jgi:molybdate-binding protein/DNA-binding XRE family transcriptional regulator
MSNEDIPLRNQIRLFREKQGWSQQELADRTGISRAGVSAIEMGKLVPSTVAALSLAKVFNCKVEELFQLSVEERVHWAWPPSRDACRYWRAMIGDRLLLYPSEISPYGTVPHDGTFRNGTFTDNMSADPRRTLVVASCDPAIGLMATEYARTTPFRLLHLSRPSRQGLQLLKEGLVHAAGLHLADTTNPEINSEVAGEVLDFPFTMLRMATWEAGVTLAPELGVTTVSGALPPKVRWIGREPGSGARQVQDQVLENAPVPTVTARGHKEVAEAVRSGWADAGISLRMVSEEAGLDFIKVREEVYDICIPLSQTDDPRVLALIDLVRSPSLRNMLGQLPGYDVRAMGEMF